MKQKSTNSAEEVYLTLSALVNKKEDDAVKFTQDFENSLSRLLDNEWQKLANRAVKAGVKKYKGKNNKAQAKVIQAAVSAQMLKFGPGVDQTIEKQIKVFYQEVTKRFIEDYDLQQTKKAVMFDDKISFSLKDKKAIEVTQKVSVQSAGKYFPDHVSNLTSKVIEDVVLESGLSINEAAIKLEAELNGALGTKAAQAVPSTFATNPQAYFSIVANNAAVQASNVGRVLAMADAGVEKYRVEAILDKRTSNICRKLHGREFAVSKAASAVDEFLKVDSVTGLQKLLPFSKEDTVPKWADEGMGFPPYHNKCRTSVIPIV
jgi:hypothetical protein